MPISSPSGGKDPARDKATRARERDRNRDNARNGGARRQTTAVQAVGNPFAGIGSGHGTGPTTQGPKKSPPSKSRGKPENWDVPHIPEPSPGQWTSALEIGSGFMSPTGIVGGLFSAATADEDGRTWAGRQIDKVTGSTPGKAQGGVDVDRDTNRARYGGGGAGAGQALADERAAKEEERRRRRAAAQQTALGSVNELLGPGVLPI